jgi:glycosyltransferase involved in cell wall biosynthesis
MPCGGFGRDYFLRYGARADRVFLCPYEPDYSLIRQLSTHEIEEACRSFGLVRGRKRLVFCARMLDFKKPALAIEAFAAIADERAEWDLVMIGDGPELAKLRSLVPERLRARVIFLGFVADQRAISAVYRASDVFVHPSVYEPWGVVINEAVAAGMAIVAARTVGAAGELLRDGVNGKAVDPGDRGSLIDGLRDTTDPTNLERYKAASADVLADWQRRGDPVAGIRSALSAAGIFSDHSVREGDIATGEPVSSPTQH